ncbi:Cna protein B-type domain./Gram positive anchor [Butyrivibrio fibrisolvens 16/4]|nr:Cna protein B-type domain./Gram positive anchor [Butyrivibrio fibrisolvens 16/4]
MKKYPILRRLLCSGLSVAMLFSTQVSVYAASTEDVYLSEENTSNTELSNTIDNNSTTNSEDISTNPSNTQTNSEEVSSNSNSTNSQEESSIDNPEAEDTTEDSEEETEEVSDMEELEGLDNPEDQEEGQEDKTFNVKKGDFNITAFVPAGTFDVDVEFLADKVELSSSEKELVDDAVPAEGVESYYAFDLRFEADGEEIEPKEDHNVRITIESDTVDTDAVVHMKDDDTVEAIGSEIEGGTVSFEADSFSYYVLTSYQKKQLPGEKKFLYKDCAYGTLRANKAYNFIDYVESKNENKKPANSWNNGRVALRVYHQNNFDYAPHEIAPANNDRVFVYGWSKTVQDFTFTVTAPENYYIARVSLYHYDANSETGDSIRNKWPDQQYLPENYQTTCTLDFNLRAMYDDNRVVNALLVDLRPRTAKLLENNSFIRNAKLVNYVNGIQTGNAEGKENRAFGDQFMFGSGQTGSLNNHCRERQVYQGLAADWLVDGQFNLSDQYRRTDKEFFPNYGAYLYYNNHYKNYITEYHDNVDVQFNLDDSGFWTLDSKTYRYEGEYSYRSGKVTPKPDSIDKKEFRPFANSDNHFGMMLPISFCIAEDGLTDDGKPAVFKFSGDDDVFVYVDNQLVLDLGGVHDAVKGQIDFQNGTVLIQGDKENILTSSVDNSCYVVDESRYITAKSNISFDEKGSLWKYLGVGSREEFSRKEHILTVVYFERGAHESNCKISYNFSKTETRTVDFTGLKVDENRRGLANAKFTLYTDESCSENSIAHMDNGISAVANSDGNGTIQFTGLSAGVIPRNSDRAVKTYYMKETQAPEGYNQAEGAIWKMVLTAYKDGSQSQELYAVNSQAQVLSFGDYGRQVYDACTKVTAIKNNPTRYAKKLTVSKKVSYPDARILDADADYVFVLEQVNTGWYGQSYYRPCANVSYVVGDKVLTTNEYGQFALKANETAVFDGLMENKYRISEIDVRSKNGYSLNNYDTKITVDNKQDAFGERSALIDFNATRENNVNSVAYKKVAEFENVLVKVFDWKLIKKSTSGRTLMGAEFTLVGGSQGSKNKYYGKSQQDGEVLWYSSKNDRKKGNNPVEIPVGTYSLSETIAPVGYTMSQDVWHITIDRENGVSAYMSKQGDLSDKMSVSEQSMSNGAVIKTTTFAFENEIAYTLPATGGRGPILYTIGGVLLMMLASLLLYKNKKKILKL